MRRDRYYHSRRGLWGREKQSYGYSGRRGFWGRNYGYDDGYADYGHGWQRRVFREQSDTGYDDGQEIPTVTSSILGFFTKLSEKGKSVLKKQSPVKVNSYTYDNCQKEGDYLELGCSVESR